MSAVLNLRAVSVVRDGATILSDVSWAVSAGERWVIIGPNGAGKTTLLELVADWETPSSGSVVVLGDDTQQEPSEWIRPRVGIASSAIAKRIPTGDSVQDAVVTAAYAISTRGDELIDEIDLRRANRVLREWGLEKHANRAISTLSEGELKRVQLARAIMTDPELLLLDEPTAGLDLGSREELLLILGNVAHSTDTPTVVMVTHHVEEIPVGFTHLLILSQGRVVAAGPIASTLTSEHLSQAYGLPITVSESAGRYTAQAVFNV
jgi:iron complex transport system ATP-binding protein